jgi:hypothetical protein
MPGPPATGEEEHFWQVAMGGVGPPSLVVLQQLFRDLKNTDSQ